jgi:hypothetical protein
MKIKLIIILFGISCLFFPGGLMEADGWPIGPLIKGAKEGIEHIPGIAKLQGAKIGIKSVQMADLCSSIELKEKQRGHPQKVNYEQYGFTIQTPPSWQPYDVTSSLVDPNEFPSTPLSDQKVAVLLFSDDSDVFNTEADGFIIIINYFDDGTEIELLQETRAYLEEAFISSCDGTSDELGYVCSDARIIGYEENGNKAEIKWTMKEKADADSQFETVMAKVILIQTDRFIYELMFWDTPSDFALYSVLYDHIEDTFDVTQSGGGCLIATAAFGSEMAPQVQFLRELRDNTVLQTQSGTSFMTGFNQFYYSFSPTIADYERDNPAFKETVKITLTPLLASLTLLQYVDIDSESEMLGYGISVILLNIGMYFVAPAVLIMKIRRRI